LPKIIQLLDGTESNTLLVEETFLSLVEDVLQKNAIAEGNIVLDESQQGPILSPSELFIAIHNMEESAGLKKCFDGIYVYDLSQRSFLLIDFDL
jgi:hypothetical protein